MKVLKGVIIVLSLASLSSCSRYYASNTEQRYLRGKNGTNLVVPPPLTTNNVSHFYDLPPQTQDARISIKPPPAHK